jgi:hypothetical protein
MWVAIDCRSKNWDAVLKSLGSTGANTAHIYYRHIAKIRTWAQKKEVDLK